MAKLDLKKKAIELRRKGFTYSEILKEIPVAKSTLSLWLRSVDLAQPQKQRISLKRIVAQKKGAAARHIQRVKTQEAIYAEAIKDIEKLSKREFWLLGVALYWGEGSKEKEWSPGSSVNFMNSDPNMISFIIRWFREFLHVKKENIIFSIFIHENSKHRIEEVKKKWADATGFEVKDFEKVFYKKHLVKSKRRNQGDLYYGCLKVRVKASSSLLRQITGWMRGIYRQVNDM